MNFTTLRSGWGAGLVIALAAFAAACSTQPQTAPAKPAEAPKPQVSWRIERLDARFDALVPANASLEKIADGHDWVEGPLWCKATNELLFSDVVRNAIYQWKPGEGEKIFLQPSGYTGKEPFPGKEPGSNGLTLDPQGKLVMCEHGDRRISRLGDDNKTRTTLVDRFRGKRINSPNDVIFSSKGDMYFTDPPFGLPKAFDDPAKELDFQGVFRLAKNDRLSVLTKALKAPNGIAFSPDEKLLYLSDIAQDQFKWHVFEVNPDGTLGKGRVFGDASQFRKNGPGGPDGLKVDTQGNLFASGPGGLYVFAPDGTHIGSFVLGTATANCAFGEDGSTLFITADKAVYRVRLSTKGSK